MAKKQEREADGGEGGWHRAKVKTRDAVQSLLHASRYSRNLLPVRAVENESSFFCFVSLLTRKRHLRFHNKRSIPLIPSLYPTILLFLPLILTSSNRFSVPSQLPFLAFFVFSAAKVASLYPSSTRSKCGRAPGRTG